MSKPGVIVGGGADTVLKQEVVDEVRLALAGSNIEVRIATASDDLDGDDPDNIVNRITAAAATTACNSNSQTKRGTVSGNRSQEQWPASVRSKLNVKAFSAGGSG